MKYFLIENYELLEIYDGICNEVSKSIKKGLDCEPAPRSFRSADNATSVVPMRISK